MSVKNRASHIRVFILLLTLLTCFIASASQFIQDVKPAKDLIDSLRDGGHVIFMRHAATDHTQKDTDRDDLTNCAGQRNLSEQGRDDVARIASTIDRLSIPIAGVFSSPYCRAKDTAAFLSDRVEVDQNLQFSISKNGEEASRLGEYLYQKILNATPQSSNIVFVGHTSNLRDGLGIWPKIEGVMVLFKIKEGQLVYQGQIEPEDWKI